MPIGIVPDDLFDREISRTGNNGRKITPVIEGNVVPSHGRNKGDTNIPDSLRQIIGEEAVINGRQAALDLAKDFGISPSSVSAYAKGATSTTTYDQQKPSIIQHINKSRRRAISKAQKTLNSALSSITQEKLDYTDAKDLSAIARNMSAIIKDLEPPQEQVQSTDSSKTPQFVIFAPSFRDERSFDSIVVNE